MEYGLFDLLKLLGALVLFLFGMKLMSEGLQKVASDRMRSILAAMTSNKYKGILTGLLITAIIQSSSATTVMLVSFVNAGLLSLTQSIGVVMGANIGTTVTAWIIAVFGFKMDMSHYVLPIMAIALPLIFSGNKKRNNWGAVIIGFALIFIGLDFLKDSTPDVNENPGMIAFFAKMSNWGYGSVLIFMVIGALITMVMQSSSAVMALTLVMCFNGWISFEMAAAMVLGQNIGTTITANLAALIANTTAKRTAMAHMLFNIIGVLLVLIFFYPFVHLMDSVTVFFGATSPYQVEGLSEKATAEAIPVALSIFHTIFNILNTLLLIWFVPSIVKLVIYLVPQKEDEEEFQLKYINTGVLSTNELSVLQATKETEVYAQHVSKMLDTSIELVNENENNKKSHKLIEKLVKYEEISDRLEEEIATYLTHITEESLSSGATEKINLIFLVISHLEEMADSCNDIGKAILRKHDKKITLHSETVKKLLAFSDLIKKQMEYVQKNLANGSVIEECEIKGINHKVIKELESLRNSHFKDLKKGTYKCKEGIIYADLYSELGKIGNFAYEVNKSFCEITDKI